MRKVIDIIVLCISIVVIFLFVIANINNNHDTKQYNCEFIRTYAIYGIYDSNDYGYLYITIRKFQEEDIQTIKVPKNISDELIVGKNYEFKYKQKSYISSDNILDIYNNSELISITSTNLTGLKQIQNDFCN